MATDDEKTDAEPLVVGIGASAGGSEPLAELVGALGEAAGLAVVIVNHVVAGDAHLLAEALESRTELPIEVVRTRTRIAARHLYIAPGTHDLSMDGDWLVPVQRVERDVPPTAIDHFFVALAKSKESDAVGVLLSGAGGDGTLGLKAIEEAGGMTIAQSPETAEHAAMPRHAIAAGVVDHVLAPKAIAPELSSYRDHVHSLSLAERHTQQRESIVAALPTVAELLQKQTRHDFRHYKTNTLVRRVQRRMQVCRVRSVDDYLARLREEADEVAALYAELLIGVTHFFRDPDTFEALDTQVLAPLMNERREPVRAWVAGCATGEEAYSLAILFRERMETMNDPPDVQIFATDIDARALDHARKAVYSAGIAERMSPERLERHFVKRSRRFHVKKDIRKLCTFSAHNLIGDPPFSRLDLITCRNVLIYLGQHLQKKLIPLFHYALRPGGHLLLGPSENISSHRDLFRMVESKHRIARRRAVATQGTRIRARVSPLPEVSPAKEIVEREPELHQIAERMIVDEFAPEWAIVDDDGRVISLSEHAARYLQLSGGQFHNNVIRMARNGLRIALKDALGRAQHQRRRVRRDDVIVPGADGSDRVTLTVQPMPRLGQDEALYLIVFQVTGDATPHEASTEVADAPPTEMEELERELRVTRRDLERTIAHLESANEELKSSNEELVSMNEELQSANEELETSQEEVHASHEALARAKNDLENVLRSTEIATLFLDDEQRIRGFTSAACDIYNVREGDVGRPLWHITHRVIAMPPFPTTEELELANDRHEAIVETSDGRFFARRVLPYKDGDDRREGVVVTFVDITPLRLSEERNRTLVAIASRIVWTTNARGEVVDDSPSWRAFTGQSVEQRQNMGWLDAIHPDDRDDVALRWTTAVDDVGGIELEYRLRHVSGEYRWTHVRAAPIFDPDGSVREWIGMNTDIHERKTAQATLEDKLLIDGLRADVSEALALLPLHDQPLATACEAVVAHPRVRGVTVFSVEDGRLEHRATGGEATSTPGMARFAASIEPSEPRCEAAEGWLDRPSGRGLSVIGFPLAVEGRSVAVVVVVFEGDASSSLPAELAPVIDSFGHFVHRRQTALQLDEIQRRLQLAVRSSDINAFDWNVDDDVVHEPLSGEEADSLPVADGPPRRFEDLVRAVHPEDRDAFRGAVDQALKTGTYDVELRRGHGDDVRWVHERGHVTFRTDGRPSQLFALSFDVTSRRRAHEAQARLAAIIEYSDDCILGKTLDGIITSWNRGAERLYGYTAEEVVGRPVNLLVPDDAQDDVPEILARLERGEIVKNYETVRQTKSGERRRVSLTVSVVRDGEGRAVGASTIARDVTEQREAQEALEEASRRKDEFLALLGHELRNPLAAVRSATELLEIHSDGDPRLARVHGALDRQVARMVRLVDGLLDVSRMARGKIMIERAPVDLAALVHQVCEDRRPAMQEAELAFTIAPLSDPVWVQGDEIRLVQIFDNLLSNAVKFTPAGGRISVAAERRDDGVVVRVKDSGAGIRQAMIGRIFEPFEQDTTRGDGLGLGLSLVKGLVELHAGRVEARSEGPGKGAEMVVWLPATTAPTTSDEAATGVELRRCRILVIEDHLDAAEMLETLLGTRGHEVVVVHDGRQGVELLRDDEVDLVLCDLGLPEMSGYEVARAIRADEGLKETRLVAMTGFGQPQDRDEAMAAGFDAYLTKPVELGALEGTIRRLLPSSKG